MIFQGQLQNNGLPLVIDGLWALDFPVNEKTTADPGKLYFTAGPIDETHGLFGYIKMHWRLIRRSLWGDTVCPGFLPPIPAGIFLYI